MQLSDLAKRGVHFIVCGTASLGLSRRIAGQNGNADATFKEMDANLIPSRHIPSAWPVSCPSPTRRSAASAICLSDEHALLLIPGS